MEATRRALDLAGAFANDGYKLRDGRWEVTLHVGKERVLAVHLYAGNEYWFSAAAPGEEGRLAVTVFDEEGRPVEGEQYTDEGRAAAGAIPAHSGLHYVRLSAAEPASESLPVTLVYSYK